MTFSILDFFSLNDLAVEEFAVDTKAEDDVRSDFPSTGAWPRSHSNSRGEQRCLFPSFAVTRGQAAACFLLLTSQVKNELSSS